MDKNNYHILSLGGSLIVPDERIDWRYLKKLRKVTDPEGKRKIITDKRFVIPTFSDHHIVWAVKILIHLLHSHRDPQSQRRHYGNYAQDQHVSADFHDTIVTCEPVSR